MLHEIDDADQVRDGYAYNAGGVGVPVLLVTAVLKSWGDIAPDGDPRTTLRAAPLGAINSPDSLARIAVQAVLEAIAAAETGTGQPSPV